LQHDAGGGTVNPATHAYQYSLFSTFHRLLFKETVPVLFGLHISRATLEYKGYQICVLH